MTILETAVKQLQNDPRSQTLQIVAGAFKGVSYKIRAVSDLYSLKATLY